MRIQKVGRGAHPCTCPLRCSGCISGRLQDSAPVAPPPNSPAAAAGGPARCPWRTWLSAAGMPDSSSHSARKLCSSKSASTWREKVTSERSLRTQYTVSSMARARPGSARPGLGTGRRAGGGGGWGVAAGSCGRAAGAGCSLPRSFPPSHARSDSLAPALCSQHGRRHPPAKPSACRPASHRCRQARAARRPAPLQRGCRKALLAAAAFATRGVWGGAGEGRSRGEECGGGGNPLLVDLITESGVLHDLSYSANRHLLCT